MTPAPAELLGVPIGGWLVAATSLVAATITALGVRMARRTREAVSMSSAWDRIERLERQSDTNRRAIRLQEEGNDAWWSWSLRVKSHWGRSPNPPEFTAEEDAAIRRARRSLEVADTGPNPVPRP